MDKLSWFKKLQLFRDYWILIKRNRESISDKSNGLNLRIDRALRIYTVYNCPEDVRSYGNKVAEKYIKEYIGNVDRLFIDLGMIEYMGIRDIKQISELDFLVIFGFKGFNTAKFMNRLFTSFSTILVGILIYFLI